jgi:hypothetical protein
MCFTWICTQKYVVLSLIFDWFLDCYPIRFQMIAFVNGDVTCFLEHWVWIFEYSQDEIML